MREVAAARSISRIAGRGRSFAPERYNQAVRDVQERLRLRVEEVDLEVHEDEFTYWRKFDQGSKRR